MEQIVPPYILYCGIAGLILLVLCFILWAIFYFNYDVQLYSSVNPPSEKPLGWKITGISTLVTAIFGIILSSFTLYGHYLIDKHTNYSFRKVNISTEYEKTLKSPPKVRKYQI